MSGKRHTVAELIRFLKQFPPDSTVWGYTGEVSGIIVSHKTMSGLAHNDGTLEVKDRSKGKGGQR